MHLLIFWAGLAIASFGLLASIYGENGAGAIFTGVLLMLFSVVWISKITAKAQSDATAEATPIRTPLTPNLPSQELPEIAIEESELPFDDDDDERLDSQSESVYEIRTRTNPAVPGIKYEDRFAGRERPFTDDEDQQLLNLYEQGLNLVSIANRLVIDQKQIAIRLIRLLLDPADVIEDEEAAENNRRSYKKGEKDEIEAEYRTGHSIDEIARSHGRTVLAIGWQLLERPSRPVS